MIYFRIQDNNHYTQELKSLKKLEQTDSYQFREALRSGGYLLFNYAAENLKTEDLKYLINAFFQFDLYSRKKEKYLSVVIQMGSIEIFQYLEEMFSKHSHDISGINYLTLIETIASLGRLELLQYVIDQYATTEEKTKSLKAHCPSIFLLAIKNGHFEITTYLKEKFPELDLESLLKDYCIDIFANAAINGRIDVLHYLEDQYPDKLQDMIKMGRRPDYGLFAKVAEKGHLPVLKYLVEKAPDKLLPMISGSQFYAYHYAAKGGHLPVLQFLEELAPDWVDEMQKSNRFSCFRTAIENRKKAVALHLLQYEGVLDFSELWHAPALIRETHHHIFNFFLEKKWSELIEKKQAFEKETPDDIFDLPENEASLYRILWRRFIREDSPENQERRLLLLKIPKLGTIVAHNKNELYQVADAAKNQTAINELLTIESVRHTHDTFPDLMTFSFYAQKKQKLDPEILWVFER